jgi:hypothetical protein
LTSCTNDDFDQFHNKSQMKEMQNRTLSFKLQMKGACEYSYTNILIIVT